LLIIDVTDSKKTKEKESLKSNLPKIENLRYVSLLFYN